MKGIAGFYYVDVEESGIYECKAKGIFRKEGQKPLVGDLVEIEILDEAEKTGNMTRILPRKNELIRPAVANIDQALVIFALENPTPKLMWLTRQRFLPSSFTSKVRLSTFSIFAPLLFSLFAGIIPLSKTLLLLLKSVNYLLQFGRLFCFMQ